jgi:hypothetical protein
MALMKLGASKRQLPAVGSWSGVDLAGRQGVFLGIPRVPSWALPAGPCLVCDTAAAAADDDVPAGRRLWAAIVASCRAPPPTNRSWTSCAEP